MTEEGELRRGTGGGLPARGLSAQESGEFGEPYRTEDKTKGDVPGWERQRYSDM